MKGTLKMAQAFEDGIGRLWDGVDLKDDFHKEIYSCPCVDDLEADVYIEYIAPGLRGNYKAFGPSSDGVKMRYWDDFNMEYRSTVPLNKRMHIQMQRALWLTLLAELAERGEEF